MSMKLLKGKEIDKIGSRKIWLGVQALFFLALAWAIFYFTQINVVIHPGNSLDNPLYFNLIRYGVILALSIMALVYVLKIVRNKIVFYEDGLYVCRTVGSSEILYDSIDHFQWTVHTMRLWGFIPVSRAYYCNIVLKGSMPVTVSSSEYAQLRKKLGALEGRLGI